MLLYRANLKIEDLFPYVETKAKYANEKCMKRANFKTAIDQIEAAVNGEDSGPIYVSFLLIEYIQYKMVVSKLVERGRSTGSR